MHEIDGSYGEGGGQILRTAVALAAVTAQPLRIINIRSSRPKPGLAAQHITALKSVAALCNATTTNLEIGASAIEFVPGQLQAGKFEFEIGTAGSITLVLQACLIPAIYAGENITLTITGGTDVKWSPPIDYFKNVFLKLIEKMGINVNIDVQKRGYYPQGGGRVELEIRPVPKLRPLNIPEPGELKTIAGVIHLTKLPNHILDRIKKSAIEKLKSYGNIELTQDTRDAGVSQGTGITLWSETAHSVLGTSALGERGVPAEKIGRAAAETLIQELQGGGSVDVHAADQLLPYMALEGGVVTVRELSMHAKTNIWLIEQILDKKFVVEQTEGGLWKVSV
ncbi:MAG: RNA 3'-terminal phosphate cyclase [Thermoplasmata archaeon]|nr:RNA 3'-terminal phosphate cyclase [Thermoplasmata archaeon]